MNVTKLFIAKNEYLNKYGGVFNRLKKGIMINIQTNGSNISTIMNILQSQILTRTPQNGEKMKITNE